MIDLKKTLKRSLFYIRQGYSIASLPLIFLGFASSIYERLTAVPLFKQLFPHFRDFLLAGGVFLIIFLGLAGYLYMKKLWFFREAQEITIESNLYTTIKTTRISLPIYKSLRLLLKLKRKQIIDERLATESEVDGLIDEHEGIIERSEVSESN